MARAAQQLKQRRSQNWPRPNGSPAFTGSQRIARAASTGKRSRRGVLASQSCAMTRGFGPLILHPFRFLRLGQLVGPVFELLGQLLNFILGLLADIFGEQLVLFLG